ncbi:MAG: glycosyl hydrolase 108 family protein [Paracoccaceae bacterium]
MSNLAKRDGDMSRLHPAIRDKVKKVRDQLQKEKIPFEVFEAFRTPQRQANLWAKGRTKPGPKRTWVGPWGSIHQYGLAVDFVLKIDDRWSWDDQGAEAKYWTRMHELAQAEGLMPLRNAAGRLIEKPHVQLAGIKASDLRAGRYPAGGDAIWAEHLGDLIDTWDGPDAPPKPEMAPERPALDDALMVDTGDDVTGTLSTSNHRPVAQGSAASEARFQMLHGFVTRWEGGFVNHPHDDGRATNMGITIATLADWRGQNVTVEDVRLLTRAEADAIFRTNYYAKTRCSELPDRTAMVVYNAAVQHGPKRAVMFLQQAFNALGMTADNKPLEVDGILGSITMAGAKQTDASVLADRFMDLQDTYFRAHHDFEHFGAGWLNRMAALREFVNTLPTGTGLRPKTIMKISTGILDHDLEDIAALALKATTRTGRISLLRAVLRRALEDDDADAKTALKEVLGAELDPIPTPHTPELTPVNAALGEGIGRVLDGKKSATGVIGLLATALVPVLGQEGAQVVTMVKENFASITTVFSVLTGWGFLGKIDKAIAALKAVQRR